MPNRTPIRGSIKRTPLKRTPIRSAKRRKLGSDDENTGGKESAHLKLGSSSDSESDINDTNNPDEKPKINGEWNKIILEEYEKAKKLFNKEILSPRYEQNRKEVGTTRYKVNGKTPLPFNLKPLKPKENRPYGDLRSYNNAVIQKCPLHTLEDVLPTPVMQYWTHTEVNLVADDEKTLSHIPFLGDGDEDVGWCDELLEVFEEGIHGTKVGCGEYINDFILYHVIKNAQEQLRPINLSKKKETPWLRRFYRHVYELFPNKLPTLQLELIFDENFTPQPEIIDENGELSANFAPTTLLNSFEALICPKCFAYDCLFHSSNQDYNLRSFSNIKTRHQKSKKSPNDKPPCSPNCYLHLLKSRNSLSNGSGLTSPKTPNTHKNLSANKASKMNRELTVQIMNEDNGENFWSPHEEAMFSLLRTVPGAEDDYCGIAKVLMQLSKRRPKSCLEVFQYAQRTAPMSPRLELPTSPKKKKKNPNDKHRKFRAAKWNESSGKVLNVNVYRPCHHAGECSKDTCECVKAENPCTKFCGCSEDCKIRFPGCRCAPGNCRTKQCQCYYASFECDPDICKSCNCDKPEHSTEPICKNVSIQRGLQKRLVVAPSEVAGWGCYAYEDIEKNDFISEYTGEVVSQMEGERRGKIYDKIKCSYLFRLNNEQSVDATRKGNIIRFANHSKHPNCKAKVVVVNGDHKIGIFALQNIRAGEELFFDYAYDKRQQIEFVPRERHRFKGQADDKDKKVEGKA